MSEELTRTTAFAGHERIACGDLVQVAAAVKTAFDADESRPILVFNDATGQQVDLDLRGSLAAVVERVGPRTAERRPESSDPAPRRAPGRPKIGVVAREVTLLPQQWEWLSAQPGGASAALRRLLAEARRANGPRDRIRGSQEATFKFMSAIAGNLPGYEEACRALFSGNRSKFETETLEWPVDVREHATKLATVALTSPNRET